MSHSSSLDEYYTELKKLLSKPKNDKDLFSAIVNSPFQNKLQATTLDLGIIVLLQVNPESNTIDRVALSDTEPAKWAVKMTPVPFKQIKIPLSHKVNIIAKAIRENEAQKTTDWKYLFVPALAAEAARFNQAGAGIACSFVYPLNGARNNGAMIFSYYQPLDHLNIRHTAFMQKYSEMAIEALR